MSEEEKKYDCPKCGHLCGPDEISGCSTFRCPSCGLVFEPEWDEEKAYKNPFWSFTKEEFLEMFERSLHHAFIRYTKKRNEKGDSWKDESVTSMEFLREGLKKETKEYFDAPIEERFNEMCDVINHALMLAEREYEEMFEAWRMSVKGIR